MSNPSVLQVKAGARLINQAQKKADKNEQGVRGSPVAFNQFTWIIGDSLGIKDSNILYSKKNAAVIPEI